MPATSITLHIWRHEFPTLHRLVVLHKSTCLAFEKPRKEANVILFARTTKATLHDIYN